MINMDYGKTYSRLRELYRLYIKQPEDVYRIIKLTHIYLYQHILKWNVYWNAAYNIKKQQWQIKAHVENNNICN